MSVQRPIIIFFVKLLLVTSIFLLYSKQHLFAAPNDLPLNKLTLPPGFKISIWAKVPQARSLAQTPDGRIFVGSRGAGQVYVIDNGKVQIFAENLNSPNGVAYKDGKLYVAEISRILEFNAKPTTPMKSKPLRELPQKFPSDAHHGWKFIRFGPDGKLYVPVGANCNVCDPGSEYARIYKIDVQSNLKEEVAQGVRNTVGFDFHPTTGELWFTDNGRDLVADDLPADELNRLSKIGANFGFPFCFGNSFLDPQFGKTKTCADSVPPAVELRAHVAPLGMRFYGGKMFPEKFQNNIILAEHGSWNRTIPQGYRLTFVKLNGSKVEKVEPFIEGWLQNQSPWGRPVDVEALSDGSLLVSDDFAGVIYRITYEASL